MNFSANRKFIKNLSMILVLVMTVTLFAGCKKEEAASTDPSDVPGLNINLSDVTDPTETEPTAEPTAPTEEGENMATVITRLNVRSGPGSDKQITYILEAGDRIEVTTQEYVVGYNWGYTPSVPGGGWFIMDFVEMDNKLDPSSPEYNQTPAATDPSLKPSEDDSSSTINNNSSGSTKIRATVTATQLKIRSEGSTDGKVLGKYKQGDKVTILEVVNNWGRTDQGWISMSYVTTSNTGTDSSTSTNTSSGTSSSATIESNGSTNIVLKGVVNTGTLNVRSKGSTDGEKLTELKYGTRVEIYQTSGNWGRTSKGWVSLSYIYKDGTVGKNTDSGVVTGDELNIRSGPGTEYSSVGHYVEGDEVKILEKFTYGNVTWGCTSKGWISLEYVDLDGSSNDDDSDSSTSTSGRTAYIATAELNIREGAGSDYDVVGSYFDGDEVVILKTSGNWGKTDKGWISLSYVEYGSASSGSGDSGTGTVTTETLRIRSGPGTKYDATGFYSEGDQITILESADGWGRTAHGWVDLRYVDMD